MTITNADFTNGPLADHGQTASRTPVTTIVDNITGHNIYTDGTPENITVVFENENQKYSFVEAGLTEGADARMFCLPSVTINKEDKITLNGKTYRVDSLRDKYFGSNSIFKTVLLFQID